MAIEYSNSIQTMFVVQLNADYIIATAILFLFEIHFNLNAFKTTSFLSKER